GAEEEPPIEDHRAADAGADPDADDVPRLARSAQPELAVKCRLHVVAHEHLRPREALERTAEGVTGEERKVGRYAHRALAHVDVAGAAHAHRLDAQVARTRLRHEM